MAKKQFQWVRDGAEDAEEEPVAGRRTSSRSARKREADQLDELVGTLLDLQPAQWLDLPLDEEVRAALVEGKRLQNKSGVRGGLRRHLLYIAGLLRRVDDEALAELSVAAADRSGPSDREVALMEVERWRTRILSDYDSAIGELVAVHPTADRQRLRQLAMAARREKQQGRSQRAFRQLFAYLREVVGV